MGEGCLQTSLAACALRVLLLLPPPPPRLCCNFAFVVMISNGVWGNIIESYYPVMGT